MRRMAAVTVLWVLPVLMAAGCAHKSSYFGVPNRALLVPESFPETDEAIRRAEQSAGAEYCPEKIQEAKTVARDGVRTYWACNDQKSREMLARARELAREAESCRPAAPPPRTAPKPAPAPPLQPAPAAPLQRVVIEDAFNFDAILLNPPAKAELDRQADRIMKAPDATVEIYGYTDSVGTVSYNMALSMRRAYAAERYLESKGVLSDRMKVFGRGKSSPIASNDTEEGRARNRRIEIRYVK